MLMNGYLPYVSISASMRQSSSDRSKPTSRSTSSPYPLGLYSRDMLHSPFLLPDFFYPLALPGFYPHLAAALPVSTVKPPERDGAKKPGRQLNFGIDAILKNEQVDEEDKKAGIEKEDSKIDKGDCKDEERNKAEVSKTILGSETKHTPKTASQKPPTFLHAAGYPPLSLHPAMQQSLASQYNFAPPPHHSYGLFERRSESGRGQCNAKRKRSWSRAVFSALQRKGLEKRFEVQKYVTKPDRRQLAAVLGLTDAQVKVWFQNRRMKWRHMEEQRKKREQEEKKQTIYKGRKLNAPADVVEKTRCAEKETAEEEHIHVTDSEMESDVGEL